MHFFLNYVARAILVLFVAPLIGCSKSTGPNRVHVSGDISWKGTPVPSGYVTFTPDVKKGTSGPQGLAWIKDGKFDTRTEKGRPVVRGSQIASIYGYDGANPSEVHPWGSQLFSQHQQEVTIGDQESVEVTFTIPDSATRPK